MRRDRARSTAEKPEKPRLQELCVMDELCLAPQLCIRCRSYGHVVSNADPCTCPDDETCSHNKNTLKKKKILVPTVHDRIKLKESKVSDVRAESDVEDDDDRTSSSSSSGTSSCSTSSSSSSSSRTTFESEESTHHRRDPTSSS